MRRVVIGCAVLWLAIMNALPAAAQRAPDRWNARQTGGIRPLRPIAPLPQETPATGTMAGMGMLGAVLGFFGGAALGYQIERNSFDCDCDDPGLRGLLVGAAVGPVLIVPPFVHLGNRRRGSLAADYGGAALVGGLGLAALFASADHGEGIVFVFAPPIAEVIVTMLLERRAVEQNR